MIHFEDQGSFLLILQNTVIKSKYQYILIMHLYIIAFSFRADNLDC